MGSQHPGWHLNLGSSKYKDSVTQRPRLGAVISRIHIFLSNILIPTIYSVVTINRIIYCHTSTSEQDAYHSHWHLLHTQEASINSFQISALEQVHINHCSYKKVQVIINQWTHSTCKLTCQVDGTESVWKKAAAKPQYYWFPGAITAYNGALHFHSHLPDIHDELVLKALRTRNKKWRPLFMHQLFHSANAILYWWMLIYQHDTDSV